AALMTMAGIAFLLEKTRFGAQVTATVLVILMAILAANLGVIPHNAPAYGFVFTYVVPVLIPLFLFQADLRRIVREASRTTVAFLVATTGTVAGVMVAASLLDLSTLAANAGIPADRIEAAIAGLFASTYIGGSVNYAALGEVTGLRNDASFFSAATAADNLFSAVYLSILALIPATHWIAKYFRTHEMADDTPETSAAENHQHEAPVSPMSLCLALAAAVGLVAVTDGLVAAFNLDGWRYVLLTALSVALATLLPDTRRWFSGAFEIGVALSFPFFASIAAGADVPAMLGVAPMLIAVVLILLTTHLIVLLGVGAVFRLTLPELVTASNAAILGATTAPALAAAKGWKDQVTPGVLVGVLGYALGTFIGTSIYNLW
ncbi:MAG: DUF819 family protein, partial [Halieaceae bacterium]|nr:DUF819 family protein [Halieaceae bacterium]